METKKTLTRETLRTMCERYQAASERGRALALRLGITTYDGSRALRRANGLAAKACLCIDLLFDYDWN